MITKKALNKEDWKQKRYYARKTFTDFQEDSPAIYGEQSFTYTNRKGGIICVYYEPKKK